MSSIQDLRAINTPAKSYLWQVEIRALPGVSIGNLSAHAKTVSIPAISVEPVIINHKSSSTRYAGRDSAAHTATIAFWDDQSKTVYGFFYNWMALIRNPVTGGGVSRNLYAAEVVIQLLGDDENTIKSEITLSRCFPLELSDISLSYDASDAIEIPVSMSYDEVIVTK